MKPIIALGIEGSANKVGVTSTFHDQCGVGVIKSDGPNCQILSNIRKTFIPPPGSGFLPRETAWHHQMHIVSLVKYAIQVAGVSVSDIDIICFTKGLNVISFPSRSWDGRPTHFLCSCRSNAFSLME